MKKFKTAIEFDSLTNKRVFASVFSRIEPTDLLKREEKYDLLSCCSLFNVLIAP